MQKATRFTFESCSADFAASTATFTFRVDLEGGAALHFTEVLRFPAGAHWDKIPAELLSRLLENIHLALGMSYWKMHCAKDIDTGDHALSPGQIDFWNTLYTKGLGEFFFRNNIDFRGLVSFKSKTHVVPKPVSYAREDRSLVALGGGKDSIVTAEMFKAKKKQFDLFSLSTSSVQKNTAALIGRPVIEVERVLDPEMIRLSKSGEVYNGHVPISSIYMFVGMLAGALYDHAYVVFSNERSANIGNVEYLGQEINHQWSKSLEYEVLMRTYVRAFTTSSLDAFSLLRPLHEIEIVRRFSKFPQYFNSFSSCNRNFSQTEHLTAPREGHAYWCGKCPKCAFVFACLAAFLSKETVVDIFGKNLFADAELSSLYLELLGLEAYKPFECVGTPEETGFAMYKAHQSGAYAGDAIMKLFEEKALSNIESVAAELEKTLLTPEHADTIPREFESLLK